MIAATQARSSELGSCYKLQITGAFRTIATMAVSACVCWSVRCQSYSMALQPASASVPINSKQRMSIAPRALQ